MKTSELIKELIDMMVKYGDKEVLIETERMYKEIYKTVISDDQKNILILF